MFIRPRFLESLELAVQELRRHEMAVTAGQAPRDQRRIALEINEADIGPAADQDAPVASLQGRAGDEGVPLRLADLVDEIGDRLQPRPAIRIAQRNTGMHLLDIRRGMKL